MIIVAIKSDHELRILTTKLNCTLLQTLLITYLMKTIIVIRFYIQLYLTIPYQKYTISLIIYIQIKKIQ